MKKFSISEYKPEEDKEYLDYLERERRESHTHIYDDYLENPNLTESEE